MTNNTCSWLKNDMFPVVLLYKLPSTSFLFEPFANSSIFSPTLSYSLRFLCKLFSTSAQSIFLHVVLLLKVFKIVNFSKSFGLNCFFFYRIGSVTVFLRVNVILIFHSHFLFWKRSFLSSLIFCTVYAFPPCTQLLNISMLYFLLNVLISFCQNSESDWSLIFSFFAICSIFGWISR